MPSEFGGYISSENILIGGNQMKEKAKEFIREAINSVPKERSWGIIIKID